MGKEGPAQCLPRRPEINPQPFVSTPSDKRVSEVPSQHPEPRNLNNVRTSSRSPQMPPNESKLPASARSHAANQLTIAKAFPAVRGGRSGRRPTNQHEASVRSIATPATMGTSTPLSRNKNGKRGKAGDRLFLLSYPICISASAIIYHLERHPAMNPHPTPPCPMPHTPPPARYNHECRTSVGQADSCCATTQTTRVGGAAMREAAKTAGTRGLCT